MLGSRTVPITNSVKPNSIVCTFRISWHKILGVQDFDYLIGSMPL